MWLGDGVGDRCGGDGGRGGGGDRDRLAVVSGVHARTSRPLRLCCVLLRCCLGLAKRHATSLGPNTPSSRAVIATIDRKPILSLALRTCVVILLMLSIPRVAPIPG